ncbi:hypothetical protein [Clostridium sp.]|uniref:hypothetical protein n=1 Tax=Clostridium sp. TaxID=1506 RepID=UPI0025C18283|nr:hypothetical protein [Clostridium sp.]MCI9304384.1 hypothetical protein [Clostridium sp.]
MVKFNKNKMTMSLLAIVITFLSIFSNITLADSNFSSDNIILETLTGEISNVENLMDEFSAEVTIDTNSGYIYEIK